MLFTPTPTYISIIYPYTYQKVPGNPVLLLSENLETKGE